jgi:hypothetical protein
LFSWALAINGSYNSQASEDDRSNRDSEGADVARASRAESRSPFGRTRAADSAATTCDNAVAAQNFSENVAAETFSEAFATQSVFERVATRTFREGIAQTGTVSAKDFQARPTPFPSARESRRSPPFETDERAGPVLAA